jgi:hypothetical protein
MIRFSGAIRFAAAAVFAVAAVAAVGGSPTGAEPLPTGSLTANGSGGVVVNYTGEPETYLVAIFDAAATCPVGTEDNPGSVSALASALYVVYGFFAGPTPVTIEEGSEANPFGVSTPMVLPAGSYQFCLVIYNGVAFVSVAGLRADLGVTPEPPTTTTTVAPTTTTTVAPTAAAPAVQPATPRFTG